MWYPPVSELLDPRMFWCSLKKSKCSYSEHFSSLQLEFGGGTYRFLLLSNYFKLKKINFTCILFVDYFDNYGSSICNKISEVAHILLALFLFFLLFVGMCHFQTNLACVLF